MTTPAEKLAQLNSFRLQDGKTPFADWRNARHQPMLDAYHAAAEKAADELVAALAPKVEEVAPLGVSTEKLPAYKVLANKSAKKSTITNPVEFIHGWLDANPDVKRKMAVATLVGLGVNYATARTQYQRWFSKNK